MEESGEWSVECRGESKRNGRRSAHYLFILLFVTVLTKPFFALVRCHFMTLALLSAWHDVPRLCRLTKIRFYVVVSNC